MNLFGCSYDKCQFSTTVGLFNPDTELSSLQRSLVSGVGTAGVGPDFLMPYRSIFLRDGTYTISSLLILYRDTRTGKFNKYSSSIMSSDFAGFDVPMRTACS